MTKRGKVVVVDGSNLATEGRTAPSLRQLDESVAAFRDEFPDVEIVVVVDATFEHRVDASERERVKKAELAGEIVTPPAGAIGRGDAFILKVAKRANGVVLSNDSFQEFHAEHPWLFEEGRLIGGKPVPRIGWIFTPRLPVRGQRSKAVTRSSARKAEAEAEVQTAPTSPPEPTPEAPRARRSRGQAQRPVPTESKDNEKDTAKRPSRRARATAAKSAKAETSRTAPTKKVPAARAVAKEKPAPAKGRTRTPAAKKAVKATKPEPAKRRAAAAAPTGGGRGRTEPANTARSYSRLVADYGIGSSVKGEVVQFTSHGALVSVAVGRTMRVICYAPLAGLGSPPPTRARDVLTNGVEYSFSIEAFDPTRRRAQLTLKV